jgi:hypothetical protein
MDAEIGHKELDWKITLSGVGKCRQVIIVVVLKIFSFVVHGPFSIFIS